MIKILFGLVATIMLSVTGNAQDITKLNEDKNFNLLINNETAFVNKGINHKLINEINSDGQVSENEIEFFMKHI